MYLMIYFTVFLTKVQPAAAYVPSLDFILTKSAATTGRQIISIEQDVTFIVGAEEATIQETWLVEGDKNLKLSAVGKGLFKSNINLHYLYNNKNKTSVVGKNKSTTVLTTDFFEKLFFIRSTESFKTHLKELSISNQVRLSRADGRVTFAIGEPSGTKVNPQIWIDQDEFVIRKIRLPSEVEIDLTNITSVSNDLMIAKSQTVQWAGLTVEVKIKNISTKTGATLNQFYPQNFDQASEVNFAVKTPLTEAIDQFYKRFR